MGQPPPIESQNDPADATDLVAACEKIREQVGRVVVGQDAVIEQLLIAILARGHCLLEGVPGLAKTLMVHTLADSMDLGFRRIQFTPDLMPGDITGTEIIQEDPDTGRRNFVFERGPIFTQMLLADEINRTPPKTQAALLEAMQEETDERRAGRDATGAPWRLGPSGEDPRPPRAPGRGGPAPRPGTGVPRDQN